MQLRPDSVPTDIPAPGSRPEDAKGVRVARFPSLIRSIFSRPVFLAFSLIVVVAGTVRGRFDDPDLWWHLKTGQLVWTNHSVPSTETFSFPSAGHFWIAHEWLGELTIYAAYHWRGYTGVMLWLVGAASLLIVLLYSLCCLYSGNPKISFLGGIVGWFFATMGMAARPALLGHLLLVFELLLLHLGRTRDRKWFWGLPVVFALWVNCHASYPFGLVVLGVTVASGFLDWNAGPLVSTAWPVRSRKTAMLASIASLAALFCNPLGWKLLTFPVNALFLPLFHHSAQTSYLIEEFLPLSLFSVRGAGLLLVAASIGLAAAKGIKLRLYEAILVSIAALMAAQHARMVFLFGIVAAPVFCRVLSGFWVRHDSRPDRPVMNGICMMLAVIAVIVSFPSRSELTAQIARNSPVGAAQFVRKAHLSGPMLNEYRFGGYLIWALPEHPVLVDGRGIDPAVVVENLRGTLVQQDPQILLQKYHIQFCILDKESPLGYVLSYLPGWRKAYGDAVAAVFIHEDGALK